MALDREFLPLMLENVVVTAQASLDKYGKQTFAASSDTYRSRLIFEDRLMHDENGREVVETGRAILFGAAASVTTQHKITLPDGSTPKITRVDTIQDEDGDHHSVIGFGL